MLVPTRNRPLRHDAKLLNMTVLGCRGEAGPGAVPADDVGYSGRRTCIRTKVRGSFPLLQTSPSVFLLILDQNPMISNWVCLYPVNPVHPVQKIWNLSFSRTIRENFRQDGQDQQDEIRGVALVPVFSKIP